MLALDLFGGKDKVVDQMTSLVQSALKKRHMSGNTDFDRFERFLSVQSGTLGDILWNKKRLNIDLFEKIGNTFGLSVFEAFGPPNWDKKTQTLWKKESKKKPIAAAGFAGSGNINDVEIPLRMYVTFKAIHELRHNETTE